MSARNKSVLRPTVFKPPARRFTRRKDMNTLFAINSPSSVETIFQQITVTATFQNSPLFEAHQSTTRFHSTSNASTKHAHHRLIFSSLIAPTRASVSSQKIVHHQVGAYVQHFFENYDVVLPHQNGVQPVTLGIFGAGASVENCAGVILSLSCHYGGRPSQMPTLTM